METALQVDLSKPEAPAEQVLDAVSSNIETQVHGSKPIETSIHGEGEKKTSDGFETAAQVRLHPKGSSRHKSQKVDKAAESEEVSSFADTDEAAGAFYLQPVDKGFGAWSYVASAFAMYIVVWGKFYQDHVSRQPCSEHLGFPQSFPIFQTYLSSGQSQQLEDSYILPLLAPGLQDIEEGILFQILPKAGRYRQVIVIVGISIICVSLAIASYSDTAWQIVATQGILFGIGGILLNFVHVSIFSEWFDKKKGEAMGIIWLGYRVGGLGFPPICQWLLKTHGYEQTLRVLIAPMLALLLPSILLLRGRYPEATVRSLPSKPKMSKVAALRHPRVLFFLLGSLPFSCVTNVPMMFITKFGVDLGIDASDCALALSFVFAGNILGTYVLAKLSDRGLHQELMGATAVLASFIHVLFWGFVKTKYGIFGYAVSIGIATGGKCLPRSLGQN